MIAILNNVLRVIVAVLLIVNCLVWFDTMRICWHKTFKMLKPRDTDDN